MPGPTYSRRTGGIVGNRVLNSFTSNATRLAPAIIIF